MPNNPVFDEFLENVKKEDADNLRQAWLGWLYPIKNWRTFITLTFREEVSPDQALAKFKRLIRYLNIDLLGTNYVRKAGHSYFSYLYAIEYQRRGVIHFHMVIDRPVNFDLIKRHWLTMAGFADIRPIEHKSFVIQYVCKYLSKEGDIFPYIRVNDFVLKVRKPIWWHEYN
jgi:hypothetical protein